MFSSGEWDVFGFQDAVNKILPHFSLKNTFSGRGSPSPRRAMLSFVNICTEHGVTICFLHKGKAFSEEKYLILISSQDCSFSSPASVILPLN